MRYWCNNANLGYSQTNRLHIWPGGAADCSSLVQHVLKESGFDTGYPHAVGVFYTGNLRPMLTARGWVNIGVPPMYALQPGDVLLAEGHHVALYLGGGYLGEAAIDERGRLTGGMDGDPTGQETRVRTFYSYPWTHVLRASPSILTTSKKVKTVTAAAANTTEAAAAVTDSIKETIANMKATHVIFQSGKALFMASILAGTYTKIPNPQALRDQVVVINRSGGKVVEWKNLSASKSNEVSSPAAFGKEVK